MIELAKAKDLSVPGVTLPGNPSLWAKYYRYNPDQGRHFAWRTRTRPTRSSARNGPMTSGYEPGVAVCGRS